MLRLIRTLGSLRFDELQIFGMQLTDHHDFNKIVRKIEKFRVEKAKYKGSYRKFRKEYLDIELKNIYHERIKRGETKTRESNDSSLAKFLRTQSSNMRDYADACFRYLRITGLVNVSHVGKSLSIIPERIDDVDYILKTVNRKPVFVDEPSAYSSYLGDAAQPKLLTDNHRMLFMKISNEFPETEISPNASLDELKDLLAELHENRKESLIKKNVTEIKDYRQYDDIQKTFDLIENNELYDTPLMLEWNTWRAMTMIDGGIIKANLKFDDYGQPLSTASGNMSDIVCDYDDFMVCVEVTMACGQRQYEMEGESVSRHLGKLKTVTGKPCYCLFIAPEINDACIAHFFLIHRVDVIYYGGKSTIVPLPLSVFRKMIEDSYKASYCPDPTYIRRFFEASNTLAISCKNEIEWFEKVKEKALHWLL